MAKGVTKLFTLLAGVVPYGSSQVPSFSSCDFKNDIGEPTPIIAPNGIPVASIRDSVEHTLREIINVNSEVYLANYFVTDDICIHERNSLLSNFEYLVPDMVYTPEGTKDVISYKEFCASIGIKNTSVLRNLNVLGHGARDILIINFDLSKFNLNDIYGRKISDAINTLLTTVYNNHFYMK